MYEPKDLAEAHRQKPPIPDHLFHEHESGILVRYDGMMRHGHAVVFAVMDLEDMAKLPESLFARISLMPDPGTANTANPHAFCVENLDQALICLDTDFHARFMQDLFAQAREGGLPVLVAQGDLKLMVNDKDEIDPPEQPAFMRNGFRPASGEDAHARLMRLREQRHDHDDSALSPG